MWICHNKGLFSIVNYIDQHDKNKETGKFQFVPADSADIDTTGDAMPEPKTGPDFTYLSPGQQKTLENIREASDSDFGMGFYE